MNTQEFTWIQTEFVRIQWIFLNTSEFAEYRKYRQNTRIAEGIQKSSLITDEYTGIHLNMVLQGRVETEVWRTKRLPLAGEEARRRLSEPHSPPHLSPSQWKSFCSSHFRFGPSLEYPIQSEFGGIQWICSRRVSDEYVWIHMNTAWLCMNSLEFARIFRNSHEYVGIHTIRWNSHEYVGIHWNSLEYGGIH